MAVIRWVVYQFIVPTNCAPMTYLGKFGPFMQCVKTTISALDNSTRTLCQYLFCSTKSDVVFHWFWIISSAQQSWIMVVIDSCLPHIHYYQNIILRKGFSLAEPEVVKTTTCGARNEGDFVAISLCFHVLYFCRKSDETFVWFQHKLYCGYLTPNNQANWVL